MNKMIAGFAVATLLAAVLPPAFADSDDSTPASEQTAPDASVQWSGGAVAAGIGYTWGGGTLAFGGETHDFSVSGMSIVDVGVTSISVAGDVYHLNHLSDFDGNYVELSAGGTLGGGGELGAGLTVGIFTVCRTFSTRSITVSCGTALGCVRKSHAEQLS